MGAINVHLLVDLLRVTPSWKLHLAEAIKSEEEESAWDMTYQNFPLLYIQRNVISRGFFFEKFLGEKGLSPFPRICRRTHAASFFELKCFMLADLCIPSNTEILSESYSYLHILQRQ